MLIIVVALCAGIVAFVLARRLPVLMRRTDIRAASTRGAALVAALTAVLAWAALAAFGLTWAGAAYVFFVLAGVQLADIDRRALLLPNVLVLLSSAATLALFAAAVGGEGDWGRLTSAVSIAAGTFVLYLALALASPTGMGMGDVKFAFVVGLGLGFEGLRTALYGTLAGFALGALFGLAMLLLRRAGLRSRLPFGPWMMTGAVLALAAARLPLGG